MYLSCVVLSLCGWTILPSCSFVCVCFFVCFLLLHNNGLSLLLSWVVLFFVVVGESRGRQNSGNLTAPGGFPGCVGREKKVVATTTQENVLVQSRVSGYAFDLAKTRQSEIQTHELGPMNAVCPNETSIGRDSRRPIHGLWI